MFSAILQEFKGYFNRDFLFTVFLPVLFFSGVSLALFLEIRMGLGKALTAWENFSLQTQTILLLSGLVAVITAAYVLYIFQYVILRIFAGYWSGIPMLRKLRNSRVALFKRQSEYLNNEAQRAGTTTLTNEILARRMTYYPPSHHLDKMMPTRFGNVLRLSQIYMHDRYGIDSAIIWTRLRPLLKTETINALEEIKISLDFSILMTLLFVAFTLIWCPVLAVWTDRWGLFLICASGWLLAWTSYRNAVQSALAYSEQIAATFDLYRYDLLKALDRPIPQSAEAERKEWLRLSRFFYRNIPLPPPAPTEAKGWERVAKSLAEYIDDLHPKSDDHDGEER